MIRKLVLWLAVASLSVAIPAHQIGFSRVSVTLDGPNDAGDPCGPLQTAIAPATMTITTIQS